jgi:hypothetical protein
MATKKHLKILNKGVDVWNKWRIVHHQINASLRWTEFREVRLREANLSGADLSGVNLIEANLSGADLSKASLRNTSMQTALLINIKLDEADLTNACLWETQRAGWSIKGVICESIFWDKPEEEKIAYNPDEFERLFAERIKLRLFYKEGISPLEIATLPALIKHLEETHPGCSLRLISIHEDSGGAVVELAVDDTDERSLQQVKQLKAAIESEAQQRIEYQRQAVIEREARLQLEGEVRQLDSVVDKLIRHHAIHISQGGYMRDTYNISGQAGSVGPMPKRTTIPSTSS